MLKYQHVRLFLLFLISFILVFDQHISYHHIQYVLCIQLVHHFKSQLEHPCVLNLHESSQMIMYLVILNSQVLLLIKYL